eukprot:1159974-Pelagomonas_calceolata.AAC.10
MPHMAIEEEPSVSQEDKYSFSTSKSSGSKYRHSKSWQGKPAPIKFICKRFSTSTSTEFISMLTPNHGGCKGRMTRLACLSQLNYAYRQDALAGFHHGPNFIPIQSSHKGADLHGTGCQSHALDPPVSHQQSGPAVKP